MWINNCFFHQCTLFGILIFQDTSSVEGLVGHHIREAMQSEFPFVVGLIRHNRNFVPSRDTICTGALITNKDILSAEHCLENMSPQNVRIIIGSKDLASSSKYNIFWWILYDEWATLKELNSTFSKNDICVIRLQQTVVDPIPYGVLSFQSYRNLKEKDVVIVGWGEVNNGSFPRMLQTCTVKILTHQDCSARSSKLVNRLFVVDKNILCTAGNPFAVLMGGDSGGPVLYRNQIVAINSGTCPLPQQRFHPDKVNIHYTIKYYKDFLYDVISN